MDTSLTPLLAMKSRALLTLEILWTRILPLSGLAKRSPGWIKRKEKGGEMQSSGPRAALGTPSPEARVRVAPLCGMPLSAGECHLAVGVRDRPPASAPSTTQMETLCIHAASIYEASSSWMGRWEYGVQRQAKQFLAVIKV